MESLGLALSGSGIHWTVVKSRRLLIEGKSNIIFLFWKSNTSLFQNQSNPAWREVKDDKLKPIKVIE